MCVQHNWRAHCARRTLGDDEQTSEARCACLRRSTDDGQPPPRSHPTPYWVLIGVGEEDRHCINAPICPLFQIPFVFPNETMSLRRNCVIAVPVPTFLPLCVHRCLAWPSRLIIRTMQRDNTEYPLRWPSDGEGFFLPVFFSTYTRSSIRSFFFEF